MVKQLLLPVADRRGSMSASDRLSTVALLQIRVTHWLL